MSRERPILFSAPMVRALLAGRKTQTRRVVNPQPNIWYPGTARIEYGLHPMSPSAFKGTPAEGRVDGADRWAWTAYDSFDNPVGVAEADFLRCPYGTPGDRLWVRETWAIRADADHDKETERWCLNRKADGCVWYVADGDMPSGCAGGMGKKRPSIFMPRWASRLTLEVEAVRVERLHEISPLDAIAEGIFNDGERSAVEPPLPYPVATYKRLWNAINGKRAPWVSNPWVWVVTFRKVPA